MSPIKEAIEALQCMVDEKADYMIHNKLGNPFVEHSTKQAIAALAALRSMPAEPVAWQARCFYPEQGDTEWGIWTAIATDNLDVWRRRVKEMPDKYELRPLFATPHTAPVLTEAEIEECFPTLQIGDGKPMRLVWFTRNDVIETVRAVLRGGEKL